MFTGIVEELGRVRHIAVADGSAALTVAAQTVVADARVGDSISVNGCCLTVTDVADDGFTVEVMGETLARTGVGRLAAGDAVNLERALRADGRLGGHIVQGHVDATATVTAVDDRGEWTVMEYTLPPAVAPYVVEKGSITVDGTSLTVMGVGADRFHVGLIPHTLAVTVLGGRRVGDTVNLEADVLAKYVERLVARGAASPYTQPSPQPQPSPHPSPSATAL